MWIRGDWRMDYSVEDLQIEDIDISEYCCTDLRDRNDVEFPCVLLGNIYITDVIPLINKIDKESNRRFPAWVEVEDTFEPVGNLSLTFDVVLLLRNLGVSITLFEDCDTVTTFNLRNKDVLEKFI